MIGGRGGELLMVFGCMQTFLLLLLSNLITCSISPLNGPLAGWDVLAELVNQRNPDALRFACSNWLKRELEFFYKLQPNGAKALLEYVVVRKATNRASSYSSCGTGLVTTLTQEEFKMMNPKTCVTFAQHFDLVHASKYLPKKCRHELLQKGPITVSGIRLLPQKWLKTVGRGFVEGLTIEHIKCLSEEEFFFVFNSAGCNCLDPLLLPQLSLEHWSMIKPECLAQILRLDIVKLPREILLDLKGDIFSAYNGPLHQETIKAMSPEQTRQYASQVPLDIIICAKLHLKYLSPESALAVTSRCLYGFLIGSIPDQRVLAERWTELSPVFETFTEDMMSVVKNIHTGDFVFMAPSMIRKIFSSKTGIKNLPRDELDLSVIATTVHLDALNFKMLIDESGFIAAFLLSEARSLPDDTFAYYEAQDYSKLDENINGAILLRSGFFLENLLDHHNFGMIVSNLSIKAHSHYCSTLVSQKSYLKKIWLREYSGVACWESLPFHLDQKFRSRAPELSRGNLSWDEFVSQNVDQLILSSHKALRDLFRMKSFCKAFSFVAPKDFISIQSKSFLRNLDGKCIASLYKLINPQKAWKLSNDAFRFFTAEMFIPMFKLTDLRPEQVTQISAGLKESSRYHVFRQLLSREILELDKNRLLAITRRQLYVHLDENHNASNFFYAAISTAQEGRNPDLLVKVLDLCESQLRERGKDLWDCTTAIQQQIPKLQNRFLQSLAKRHLFNMPYTSVSITKTSPELCSFLLKRAFLPGNHRMIIPHNPLTGFNLRESFETLKRDPNTFSNPFMEIMVPNFIDAGGPQRAWIEQMLMGIMSNFMEPASESDMSHRKFSWLVGREVGYLAGLLLGKALQKRITPPFAFKDDFWTLLLNPTSEATSFYYNEIFQIERTSFCAKMLQQDTRYAFDATIVPYVRPSSLTFSSLYGKSNIYAPVGKQVLSDEELAALTRENIIHNYFSPLDTVIRNEFHEVVRHFVGGLSKTIYTHYFPFIRQVNLLTELFKTNPLSKEAVLAAIEFASTLENKKVKSLIHGHEISIANVIRSYIMALEEGQLTKFLKVWTGVALLSPEYPPQARMSTDYSRNAYGYFWTDPKTKKPINIVLTKERAPYISIGAGEEYRNLVRSVAKFQHEILQLKSPLTDPFDPKFQTAHDGTSIASTVSTCFQLLFVRPQSAGALVHSLVVLNNMSTGDYVG